MNQSQFLSELADLLARHKVAICCPGIDEIDLKDKKHYSHIEFIYQGDNTMERMVSSRMHITAHDVNGMIKQLKLPVVES